MWTLDRPRLSASAERWLAEQQAIVNAQRHPDTAACERPDIAVWVLAWDGAVEEPFCRLEVGVRLALVDAVVLGWSASARP